MPESTCGWRTSRTRGPNSGPSGSISRRSCGQWTRTAPRRSGSEASGWSRRPCSAPWRSGAATSPRAPSPGGRPRPRRPSRGGGRRSRCPRSRRPRPRGRGPRREARLGVPRGPQWRIPDLLLNIVFPMFNAVGIVSIVEGLPQWPEDDSILEASSAQPATTAWRFGAPRGALLSLPRGPRGLAP
ncbi:unnamed protein product, partial [Prorocentrum cordatum]